MRAQGLEQDTIIEVPDGAGFATLEIGEPRAETIDKACARERRDLRGIGGTVSVGGEQWIVVATTSKGAVTRRHVTSTLEAGAWRLCLPSDETVRDVRAFAGVRWIAADSASLATHRVVDFHSAQSGAVVPADSALAFIEIRAKASSGAPMSDVDVQVRAEGRDLGRRRTDAAGLALFVVPAPAELLVSARRIGFEPATFAAQVGPGRNTLSLALLTSRTVRLDTVRVIGGRQTSARLDGFRTRAHLRLPNRVLREADLGRYSRLSDAVASLAGVIVVDSGGVKQARTLRAARLAGTGNARLPGCRLRLVLDGTPQPVTAGLDDGPSASQIFGVEVYLSASRIPAEFGGTLDQGECGVLVAWTKDGSGA